MVLVFGMRRAAEDGTESVTARIEGWGRWVRFGGGLCGAAMACGGREGRLRGSAVAVELREVVAGWRHNCKNRFGKGLSR